MSQFVDECRERLFIWAKANAAALARPEFSDENLKRVVRRLACNARANVWREIKRGRLEHLDDYLKKSRRDMESGKLTPVSLKVWPQVYGAQDYAELEDDFARARWIMPRFTRALRAKKKMRALLALLHRLGRSEGKLEQFPAHWFVWRLLRKKKKTHLPRYIREHLRACLPQVEYEIINARLGYLKRALVSFLLTL